MFVWDEDRQTALNTGIVTRANRAVTIFNGVNLQTFHPPSSIADARARISLRSTCRAIGIVGRIVREKGHREFLAMARAIASQYPETVFVVVGDSLESDRDQFGPKFRAMVAACGLENRFLFTGMTSCVQMYLQALDVFVLPSYREGFPRSILEAMATGLPVVTTNIRGCREAVVEGLNGLIVPPRDADALTVAVRQLLDDPQRASAMGEASLMRVRAHFTEEVVAGKIVGICNEVMNIDAVPATG